MQKNILLKIAALLVLVLTGTGCGKEEEKNTSENEFVHGAYRIEITQSGDIDSFDFLTSVYGGNGLNSGVYNEKGEPMGMNYTLTDSEARRKQFSYHTADDGITIGYVQIATCEDMSKSLNIHVKVYFNDQLFDEMSHTFQGPDSSPWSHYWTQIK